MDNFMPAHVGCAPNIRTHRTTNYTPHTTTFSWTTPCIITLIQMNAHPQVLAHGCPISSVIQYGSLSMLFKITHPSSPRMCRPNLVCLVCRRNGQHTAHDTSNQTCSVTKHRHPDHTLTQHMHNLLRATLVCSIQNCLH